MTTRVIKREFVYQPSAETPAVLYPRSDGRWGGFQNTYAVWPTPGNEVNSYIIKRLFTAPYTGTYYFRSTVDNGASVYVDGAAVGGTANFNQTPSRVAVTLNAGVRTLQFNVSNGGDVAGFALTISNSSDVVIWDTRTYANTTAPTYGRFQITMPFRANITAHAWGAGAGPGGLPPEGGRGSPGLYNTTYFPVNRGDVVEVFIGTGGQPAAPTVARVGSTPGGAGGRSVTNIGGDAAKSFNGGAGGRAGPGGWSGAGGGGGGASGVLVNSVPAIVAGGGGGGAGGGAYTQPYAARQQGVITKNATGASGTDYRGESGSSKGVNEGGSDGGGAGGGGGGYPGGQGGGTPGGDIPGESGQCGGNYPIYAASTGTNSPYYKSGYAGGSDPPNGTGQDGRVVLLIEPVGLTSIKIADEWKQVSESFIKVSGSWKSVTDIFVKVNDSWRTVENSGVNDVTFIGNSTSYGAVVRSFS
jgi:hypothetical protein